MEKEFIPYEEALALKELGFDEACFGAFYADIEKHKTDKYDVRKKFTAELDVSPFNNETRGLFKNSDKDYYIASPLYQQAFRWFREKYNLPSHIHTIWQHDWNKYSYQWHIIENKVEWNSVDHFESYEQAELECLRELIRIVKEK